MSWLEFWLAFFGNLSAVFGLAAGGLALVILFICGPLERPSRAKKLILPLILCLVLGCIPSVSEIWKVRIGLIKLQLSSPENIAKGVETIEHIGKKLECKYLGCKEEKPK